MKASYLHNKAIGTFGEELAAFYLLAIGYLILDCNVRYPVGEIDLVAEKDGMLHFIEVKTRTSNLFGSPEEAVHPKKLQRLRLAASRYLESCSTEIEETSCQVISITLDRRGEIEHIEQYIL